METTSTTTNSIPAFPTYRDAKIEKIKRNPPRNLRQEPYKTAMRLSTLTDFAEEMERFWQYMWMMVNEDISSPIDLYGIKNSAEVMKLADALFNLSLHNRWMYSHAAELKDVAKLTGESDRLVELLPRVMRTKQLIRTKVFVTYEGQTGKEIKEYVKNLETVKWTKLALEMTKSLKTLRRQMFYMDHEADNIIRWKDRYLESSMKIERLSILCLDLMLHNKDDKYYKNFEEYAATLV